MDTNTIPLEAGLLERAISTTKGCYVGQELVIRVLHRGGGRVARRLVKLAGSGSPPSVTTELFADGARAGHITSAAPSLDMDGFNALGYVQRDHAVTGRVLTVGGANEPAEIVGFA